MASSSIAARTFYSPKLSQSCTAKRTASARRSVMVSAAARPCWFPGGDPAAHLDGTMPCDYGFDPLGLGTDPELLKWFRQAELQHCRWAMIGTAGILFPEIATKAGVLDLPVWFEAGAYKGFPIDGLTLFWMQMILMNWAEVRRWMDMKEPGCVNEDPLFKGQGFVCTGTEPGYPGGKWFNPLSMAATPEEYAKLQRKEIANGRLAMVAMVGFASQAFVTGKGPVDNWLTHLADPSGTTIFQNMGI